GVETEEQLQMLVNYDCQMLQGYLLSRPVDYACFIDLLQQQTRYRMKREQQA
ncbi:MAG: EAL domain-containing protein, partial [Gammaproteobacteria bacterium]|nr:EAL domain-containing protein [Gammaproteobacteria bacterium]